MTIAIYPSLDDCTVLITGGASGIGAAMVEAFANQGARVAFFDILDEEALALVARLAGAKHDPVYIKCDLSDVEALRKAVLEVEETLGAVGVLVNNAARDDRHSIEDVSVDYWDAAMAVNLRHFFFAAKFVRRNMSLRGGGAIINLSSVAWMSGANNMIAYTTAKAGVVGLTNSLAREFGADNNWVNSIAPGAVMTDRQMKLWFTEDQARDVAQRQFINQRLEPEDVARAALFLASNDSKMITKQCLLVDAGIR